MNRLLAGRPRNLGSILGWDKRFLVFSTSSQPASYRMILLASLPCGKAGWGPSLTSQHHRLSFFYSFPILKNQAFRYLSECYPPTIILTIQGDIFTEKKIIYIPCLSILATDKTHNSILYFTVVVGATIVPK